MSQQLGFASVTVNSLPASILERRNLNARLLQECTAGASRGQPAGLGLQVRDLGSGVPAVTVQSLWHTSSLEALPPDVAADNFAANQNLRTIFKEYAGGMLARHQRVSEFGPMSSGSPSSVGSRDGPPHVPGYRRR